METREFPIGKIVWNHKTKETLININEIKKCLEEWKEPEEVRKLVDDIQHRACTILLYGDVWLLTELR